MNESHRYHCMIFILTAVYRGRKGMEWIKELECISQLDEIIYHIVTQCMICT